MAFPGIGVFFLFQDKKKFNVFINDFNFFNKYMQIGRNVFTNPKTGKYYKLGETFKQLELLKVLQSIANDGVGEMYTGAWAKDMVSLVKKENGVITMSDMSNYTVNWKDPINTTYHDYFASTSGGYLFTTKPVSGSTLVKLFGYLEKQTRK